MSKEKRGQCEARVDMAMVEEQAATWRLLGLIKK